jgi:hypothetical protein
MRWASGNGVSPSAERQGWARFGLARLGVAWRGMARQGSQTVARRASAFPATLTRVDLPWQGVARLGLAGCGTAWHGAVRAADGSTEPLRRFPAALFGGQTRRGSARFGALGRGTAWRGQARQGLTISARRA